MFVCVSSCLCVYLSQAIKDLLRNAPAVRAGAASNQPSAAILAPATSANLGSFAKMPIDNALHIAAKSGDLVQVQSQVGNFDINAKGKDGGTALYWSARKGHTGVLKLLLTFHPDVNIPSVSTRSK